MKYKVYVDGQAGTTGLEIYGRLASREDIELLSIDPGLRHDLDERRRLLNAADIVFLCLPDAAAREAVSLVENPATRIIDASTAHRTQPGWVYGFPELEPGSRQKIRSAARVAVPGCYATGFTAAVHPLRVSGVMGPDYPICCNAFSGYSGGGGKMIQQYKSGGVGLDSPRLYALGLAHKHLPEMVHINGLNREPIFTPAVGNYYKGMLVCLPLAASLFKQKVGARAIHTLYSEYYRDEPFIRVMPFGGEAGIDGGYLDAEGCNGTNRLELFVFGGDERILVVSRLDNLGKGASGAAVQCMNLMLGIDETLGL